jgi:excisionase family DNA binding protein
MSKQKCSLEEEKREKGEEILSLNEAAKFLCASKSFMYKMTSQKIIPHYIPGGKRIYFKKSDLEDWLLKNRIPPTSELETNTESYLCQTSKKI